MPEDSIFQTQKTTPSFTTKEENELFNIIPIFKILIFTIYIFSCLLSLHQLLYAHTGTYNQRNERNVFFSLAFKSLFKC